MRTKYSDDAYHAFINRVTPIPVPMQGYGPHKIQWTDDHQPVWAWLTWADKPMTRVEAYARGWNDRVVIVTWFDITNGGTLETTVWRSAVTKR